MKKCHGAEADHGRQRRETAEKPQVREDLYVTCRENLHDCRFVLATDGTVDTARHLGLDDWEAIVRSDRARLSGLLQHCHEWEENADPDGHQFPRAKRHDDKAIATISLS